MVDYLELHCHSNFSLLDGASRPDELARRAAELGMRGLALTDHDAIYGAVQFIQAARANGLWPILGAELTLTGGHHLTVLVKNEAGWGNLCRLISLGRRHAPKGEAVLAPKDLHGHTEGLIALSGCVRGEIATALRRRDWNAALAAGRRSLELFRPGCFWIELQHHLLPDGSLIDDLLELADHLRLGCVVTNNVHYAVRERRPLQDVLIGIRHQSALDEIGARLRPNSEFCLKSGDELAGLVPERSEWSEAVANSCEIAERCRFELRYGIQDLPCFPTPAGLDARAYLRRLCNDAIAVKYAEPSPRVHRQVSYELSVIERAGLANYFLIVWDIVRFSRQHGILCQGRGSAANSLVAYLLDITPVDPQAHDLVFERFLSDERAVTPDIDIDFQADRREEVIQYIYRRYGPDHTAMACTYVTFRSRSALRDVGKALDLSAEMMARASGASDGDQTVPPPVAALRALCDQIDGFPRHLGIHNGGMVITGAALIERVPTEPATMPGRVVVQWDKEVLEEVGLVKIDILGLRMLSAVAEMIETIRATMDPSLDLDRLTFDDPAIYEMISRADTVGVFQVESRAQAQVLPRLQPRSFADIIVSISLIRPGPLQGNMVHPYLRRRLGREPVVYLHPLLEPALRETLGVILYQEQVLKVTRDLAGFTPGQGEQMRRALGGKRPEEVERFRTAFIDGARARGVPEASAHAVFDQLKAFGGYSFPKSHAAAFAVLVYRSAWLKRYHPAPFFAALLNHQPMGFWSPAVLVGDARRHGVESLPVDVHRSRADCTIEKGNVRLGFLYVDGMGEGGAARIEEARRTRPFAGLADFCKRTRLPRRVIENVILVGAMDNWGIQRRKLLWELGKLRYQEEELDLVFPEDGVELAPLTRVEELSAEYGVLGLSTGDHIMALYRPWLSRHKILNSRELEESPDGKRVRLAGWAVVRQAPPTAKGHRFITLEDEEGMINVIVRPDVFDLYRRVLWGEPLLIVEGMVQRKDGIVNLIAERAAGIPRTYHRSIPLKTADFSAHWRPI